MATPTNRERALFIALQDIVNEVESFQENCSSDSSSYLPDHLVEQAVVALSKYAKSKEITKEVKTSIQKKINGRGGVLGGTHKPHKLQPLGAADQPNALLTFATVQALTGLGRSTINKRIVDGKFPKPIRMGVRCTRFKAGDVTAWIKSQVAA